jgi:hypothetical protein
MADRAANPFVGPRAFEAADRKLFFGRDEDARRLRSLIVARKAVLLYAPSGAGKSSLLRAGLLPGLPQEIPGLGVFPVVRLSGEEHSGVPGNPYVRHLLACLPGHDDREGRQGEAAEEAADERRLETGLRRGFAALSDVAGHGEIEAALLVIDQLEEIFAAAHHEAACRDFLAALTRTLARLPRISLLLALREDYLAHMDPYLHLFPDRLRARFRLEFLRPEAAMRSIRGPAALAGLEVEEIVARKVVEGLRRCSTGHAGAQQKVLAEFVDPVQLQVVCRRSWDALPPGTTHLEIGQMASLGTVDELLGAYYAEQIAVIATQTGTEERALRRWIGRHLITEEGLRSQVRRESGRTLGLADSVLAGLVEARLVRTEMRRGVIWYELSHDRLVSPIHADNETWRKRHRRRKPASPRAVSGGAPGDHGLK